MTRASISSTAQPARDLTAPCKEANPLEAQQAVAELLVAPLTRSVPVQSLREPHVLPC